MRLGLKRFDREQEARKQEVLETLEGNEVLFQEELRKLDELIKNFNDLFNSNEFKEITSEEFNMYKTKQLGILGALHNNFDKKLVKTTNTKGQLGGLYEPDGYFDKVVAHFPKDARKKSDKLFGNFNDRISEFHYNLSDLNPEDIKGLKPVRLIKNIEDVLEVDESYVNAELGRTENPEKRRALLAWLFDIKEKRASLVAGSEPEKYARSKQGKKDYLIRARLRKEQIKKFNKKADERLDEKIDDVKVRKTKISKDYSELDQDIWFNLAERFLEIEPAKARTSLYNAINWTHDTINGQITEWVNQEEISDPEIFDIALEINPKNSSFYAYKALALINLKEFEQAEETLNLMLDACPNPSVRATEFYMSHLRRLGHFDKMTGVFLKTLQKNLKANASQADLLLYNIMEHYDQKIIKKWITENYTNEETALLGSLAVVNDYLNKDKLDYESINQLLSEFVDDSSELKPILEALSKKEIIYEMGSMGPFEISYEQALELAAENGVGLDNLIKLYENEEDDYIFNTEHKDVAQYHQKRALLEKFEIDEVTASLCIEGNILKADQKRNAIAAIKALEQDNYLEAGKLLKEQWPELAIQSFGLGTWESGIYFRLIANTLFEHGQYDRALDLYNTFGVLHVRAKELSENRDEKILNIALKYCEKALSIDSSEANLWVTKSKILQKQGKLEEAIECGDFAMELDPDTAYDDGLMLNRAIMQFNLKNYEEMNKSLEVATRLVNLKSDKVRETWEELWEIAIEKLDSSDSQEAALRLCDTATELFSETVKFKELKGEVYFGIAARLRDEDSLEESLEFFDKAKELRPKDYLISTSKACALLYNGKTDEALEEITVTNEILKGSSFLGYPTATSSDGERLRKLLLQDCVNAAIETGNYEFALKVREKIDAEIDASWWVEKADKLSDNKNYHWAMKFYDVALEIQPDNCDVLIKKSARLCEDEELGEALKCSSKAIEVQSEYPEAWKLRGDIYRKQGRLKDALNDYRRALELDPEDKKTRAAGEELEKLIKEAERKLVRAKFDPVELDQAELVRRRLSIRPGDDIKYSARKEIEKTICEEYESLFYPYLVDQINRSFKAELMRRGWENKEISEKSQKKTYLDMLNQEGEEIINLAYDNFIEYAPQTKLNWNLETYRNLAKNKILKGKNLIYAKSNMHEVIDPKIYDELGINIVINLRR